MQSLKPGFARKLLLGIGLDPDVFLKEVRTGSEAEFLISKAILARDQFYHPDMGRRTTEEYQEWSQAKQLTKSFSPKEIYMSLKLDKKTRRRGNQSQAESEAYPEAQERDLLDMERFTAGTYQRELEENISGRYFLIRNQHGVYKTSGISLGFLLTSPYFQRILEEEQQRRREKSSSEKMESLEEKLKDLEEKTRRDKAEGAVVNGRIKELSELMELLRRADNPASFYREIINYHRRIEDEIKSIGHGGLLERLYEEYQKIPEGKETMEKEIAEMKNPYLERLQSLRRDIRTNQNHPITKLAELIIERAQKGPGYGLSKFGLNRKLKIIKKAVKRKKSSDALQEMIDVYTEIKDRAIAIRKKRIDTGFPLVNLQLLSQLPRDLLMGYSASRELIRKLTGERDYIRGMEETPRAEFLENQKESKKIKRAVISELKNRIEMARKHSKEIGKKISRRKEQIAGEKRGGTEISRDADETQISQRRIWELFFSQGPPIFKGVYKINALSKVELAQNSIVYLDEKMGIHFLNVLGTEEEIPGLNKFNTTERRAVAVCNTDRLYCYLREERKAALLSGMTIAKFKGENLQLRTLFESRVYQDFVVNPEKRLSILSVEKSDHGELFRVEGTIISKGFERLEDLLSISS
jgi:hypothetical protein